ncbi:MAG: hypothetical protein AAGI91_06710 [Bacteroidota bacterium]
MSDDPRTYQDWVSVFNTSTDYEADLVRDRLDAAGLAAVVLTQRDHSFNLNVGDMAAVRVMVRPEDVGAAQEVINAQPFTDAELTEAALSADPDAEDAYTADEEGMLDSGPDALRFSAPDDDEPVKK